MRDSHSVLCDYVTLSLIFVSIRILSLSLWWKNWARSSEEDERGGGGR